MCDAAFAAPVFALYGTLHLCIGAAVLHLHSSSSGLRSSLQIGSTNLRLRIVDWAHEKRSVV